MLVVSAKYVAPLKVELHFNDGTVKIIDVGAFILMRVIVKDSEKCRIESHKHGLLVKKL